MTIRSNALKLSVLTLLTSAVCAGQQIAPKHKGHSPEPVHEKSHAAPAHLTNDDKALIEACKSFKQRHIKEAENNLRLALVGKIASLTQPGLNAALMEILKDEDPNLTHLQTFMKFFKKGQIKFQQDTADAILLFAVKISDPNILVWYDARTGVIDKMYSHEVLDKALMIIVKNANIDMNKTRNVSSGLDTLKGFTHNYPGHPKATPHGVTAALTEAKKLNKEKKCPSRGDGCMDEIVKELTKYAKTIAPK